MVAYVMLSQSLGPNIGIIWLPTYRELFGCLVACVSDFLDAFINSDESEVV